MIVSAIVATAHNNVIGKDNQIPWYLPADLKYFKKTTLNHHIIMGRNSYHSIGRPLPLRTNIIITRDPFFIAQDCLIAHSVEEALQIADDNGETEAFIIGGGIIYDISQQYWDKIYLTKVHLEVDGEVFFPEIDPSEWTIISESHHEPDERNEHAYDFIVMERNTYNQEEE
jgi:dihydrofolate reductase